MSESRPSSEIDFHAVLNGAWQRMVGLLFQPFDLHRWFWLGLCAWLAYLGEQGGGNVNSFRGFGGNDGGSGGGGGGAPEAFTQVAAWLKNLFTGEHAALIIATLVTVGVLLILLAVAAALTMSWIKARFEFIFLDNILHGTEDIQGNWRRFRAQGNSLFLWRLGFGLASAATMILLLLLAIGGPVLIALPSIRAHAWQPSATIAVILGVAMVLLLVVPVAFALGVVHFLLRNFVVQVMYRRWCTATEAWRALLPPLRSQWKAFALFVMLAWGLAIAGAFAAGLLMLATCCFCCLALIPILGGILTAIVTLPIPVFLRFLGIEFLARIGQEFSILPEAEGDSAMADAEPSPQTSPVPDEPGPDQPTAIPLAD
jgi:hypothetical protein